jgi:hypothetical protein
VDAEVVASARRPNSPKQNQAIPSKILGFAWFYSSDSGLFNGLRRKKYKKSFPLPRRPRTSSEGGFDSSGGKTYSIDSDFRKQNSMKPSAEQDMPRFAERCLFRLGPAGAFAGK